MKDDHRAHGKSPSNHKLETKRIKTSSQLSDVKAEAYKLKRWREQAEPIRGGTLE